MADDPVDLEQTRRIDELTARLERLGAALASSPVVGASVRDLFAGPAPLAVPPDVADGQVIFAAHINDVKNNIYSWQSSVNANRKELHNTTRIGVGEGNAPLHMLHIMGTNVAGADAITGIQIDRLYDAVGDSADIVFGTYANANRTGRLSCAAVGPGVGGFIFYAQNGGDGYANEVMRMHGTGLTIMKCPQGSTGDAYMPNSSVYLYLYEPGNQVAIRVKTSTGAIKQAVFTLS